MKLRITKAELKNVPKKPLLTTKRYDGLLIDPLDEDSWKSGYRDLNIYGYIKNENGIIIENVYTKDVLHINSFFEKLKNFEISIDIPFSSNIIHLSCHKHLIEVTNNIFKLIKDKRK